MKKSYFLVTFFFVVLSVFNKSLISLNNITSSLGVLIFSLFSFFSCFFLNLLIILYSDIISLYNGVLDIHLKGYINEIAKYKNYLSYDAAKKNLELVYSLVLKLQNNVMPKNILNNLFEKSLDNWYASFYIILNPYQTDRKYMNLGKRRLLSWQTFIKEH